MHCESYVSCLGPFGSILMQFWDLFTLLYWIVAFSRMLLDGASAVIHPSRKPFLDDNLVSPGHHRYYALGSCGIFLPKYVSLQCYPSCTAYLCTSQISSRPSPHVRWTGSTSEEFTGLHTRCSQPLPSSLRAFFSRLTESLIWLVKVPPSLMQENHHLTVQRLSCMNRRVLSGHLEAIILNFTHNDEHGDLPFSSITFPSYQKIPWPHR
jgi:hypothetical protein